MIRDIIRVKPIQDFVDMGDNTAGRYIPYCNFEKHQGVVTKYQVCIDRKCTHFKKLYL